MARCMPDALSRRVVSGCLAAHRARRQAKRVLAVLCCARATKRGVACPCSCMTVAMRSASCQDLAPTTHPDTIPKKGYKALLEQRSQGL
jgi:hypothetical protein